MKIVLFQPQIPQNTGNIARTCVSTNTDLILVRPLGFSLSDRQMKRAGLDYWEELSLQVVDQLDTILEEGPCFFLSSKATSPYPKIPFTQDSVLIFGSETEGLPSIYRNRYPEKFFTIPMASGKRCLNLAASVAIVLYEGLRQTNFSF